MVDVDGYDGEVSRLFVAINSSCDTHLMVTLVWGAMILMMMMLLIVKMMMMMKMMMMVMRMMMMVMRMIMTDPSEFWSIFANSSCNKKDHHQTFPPPYK